MKEKLLLHGCCAPCSTHPVTLLREKFDVTLFFYNPNIHPDDEYYLRVAEMKKLSSEWQIPLIIGRYDTAAWFKAVSGHEDDPEGGPRCAICFRLRLDGTAGQAQAENFGWFATTLSVSPHKNADVINRIGRETAGQYGIRFYEANFKKRDGFRTSCEMSEEFGFYRQNYCGCVYSRRVDQENK